MKEIKNFGYYIFNKWSKSEAYYLFGEDLGNHIYQKWFYIMTDGSGDQLYWFMNLDTECQKKIIDRANEIYN